ncbi:hypothetical protein [Pseudorhodobacter sp.]|uniref:hypothetical protein n=1 Tax=Pseudorhodobacter sp. TaxID=1934400 RepID=UPI00264894B8|nr:hypothetical protein [Pseudorhodobacter sp.]MDN5788509.1 hypothetical protein [Pseudorhodobacter sp.]
MLLTKPYIAGEKDQALCLQCLQWAFETRDLSDVPHMHVVNVAQRYCNVVTGRHQPWLDWVQTYK